MNKSDKIFIAGHNGLVGKAIVRTLKANGFDNLLFQSSKELDLRNQFAVHAFFEQHHPDYVFMAAAKVGGILANSTYPADFFYDNSMIQNNVIHAAYQNRVKKMLFLGSSCIYPKHAQQPIEESALLSGYLEPTNDAYALAKIGGIRMCRAYHEQYGCNFISAMPTNLYGPGDHYDLQNSHVLPALLRKFHEAKMNKSPEVVIWGTGQPRREFLHVDDAAQACLFLMENYEQPDIINIGSGIDHTIEEMARLIQRITGYNGQLVFDTSKPDGMMKKQLNVQKINRLGWKASIDLESGLSETYADFCRNYDQYIQVKQQ
jgi:GDP-L-fucose synthase